LGYPWGKISGSTTAVAPQDILAVAHSFKVFWIDAQLVTAKVIYILSLWEGHAVGALVGEPVRRGHLPALTLIG